MKPADPREYCAFCLKNQKDVVKLIRGEKASICDSCVVIGGELIKRSRAAVISRPAVPYPYESGHLAAIEGTVVEDDVEVEDKQLTPREIKHKLDDYIVGQDEAKELVSVAVYNHYIRVTHNRDEKQDIELSKSNVLILGSTGCGKTLLAQTVAKVIDTPFTIADATSITEAGYVGGDVESILSALLDAAGGDLEKAERGIIYIDEVDKCAKKDAAGGRSRDVSGEGVQQALLKMIEGSEVEIEVGKGRPKQMVTMDTTNILFMFGGAFSGITDIVAAKKHKKGSIGFGQHVSNGKKVAATSSDVTVDDIIAFGMIPEFIGRIPVIAPLKTLDVDDLLHILTVPKNSIVKQFKILARYEDIDLHFTHGALKEIAKEAMKRGTGARGLRSIVENVMTSIMFKLPDEENVNRCVIGKRTVLGGLPTLSFVHKKTDKEVVA